MDRGELYAIHLNMYNQPMTILNDFRSALEEFIQLQPHPPTSMRTYVDTIKMTLDYVDDPEVELSFNDFPVRDGLWNCAKGLILAVELLEREPTTAEEQLHKKLRDFHEAYMKEFEEDYH